MPSLPNNDSTMNSFPNRIEYLLKWTFPFNAEVHNAIRKDWLDFLNLIGYDSFELQVDYFFDMDAEAMADFVAIRRLDFNQPILCSPYILTRNCHCTCQQREKLHLATMAGMAEELLFDLRGKMI